MDRSDLLRKLQKGQHDREYRHVATPGPPPLGVDKDLQEKSAALSTEIESLRGRPPQPFRKTYAPSSASMTPSTAVPGSRATFGGSSASRAPFVVTMDDDL